MRFRILALTLMTLAVRPVGAGERLAVKVSPRMAFAPADLNVLTSIEHNDDNRTVEIIAESEQFYRSSEFPLEGGLAPKSTYVRFRNLPVGDYTIRAIVRGSTGRELAISETIVSILGRR